MAGDAIEAVDQNGKVARWSPITEVATGVSNPWRIRDRKTFASQMEDELEERLARSTQIGFHDLSVLFAISNSYSENASAQTAEFLREATQRAAKSHYKSLTERTFEYGAKSLQVVSGVASIYSNNECVKALQGMAAQRKTEGLTVYMQERLDKEWEQVNAAHRAVTEAIGGTGDVARSLNDGESQKIQHDKQSLSEQHQDFRQAERSQEARKHEAVNALAKKEEMEHNAKAGIMNSR